MSLIVSAVAVLAVMVVTLIFGDYFFDLNDDVLMKDILSGAYTGVPEGHNIQMLYPISLFISVLYKTGINLDWYGIFLCALQYLCLFIIVMKIEEWAHDNVTRFFYAVASFAVILGFFWPHLLYVQYTVVCGLLSATAAFLILMADENDRKSSIISVIFIILAYLIRSEMLLLTLPMVGVAILIKWAISESYYRKCLAASDSCEKKNLLRKYVALCLLIVIGLLVSSGIHKLAYSRADWKEFNRFFDNRTELYDFQYIPDYAENKEFYDSIGLSESEQKLLVNYNFALDDEINADILGKIADYAARTKGQQASLFERLRKALSLYIYRLHHVAEPVSYEYPMTDYPWNVGVLLLYLFLFINILHGSIKGFKHKLLCIGLTMTLFVCRSVLWMYIILRGRDPIRITHPLYIIEMLILIGMMFLVSIFIDDTSKYQRIRKSIVWTLVLIMGIVGTLSIYMQERIINNENNDRQVMLNKYHALYNFFDENPDKYYLVDVYTSVSLGETVQRAATFSEKMFDRVDNSFDNHDLLGGWASKSPIYSKKLKKAGFDNVQDALLANNTYFVQNKTFDIEWLSDYYQEKGINIRMYVVDEIADAFTIYKLERDNWNE
ncbi:hypothetical protein [Butyrivibrio proteoclasticus]|uniref:hypothetical protein n=1 Tax=Butyrivibrio proteoclasticus TaxID=43305 RepID=UPI001A9A6377|nr:hypothetical protein [Butyrivibrio proteoclasticus]